MSEDVRKIKQLEDQVKRLEDMVKRLAARVDYHDRERQRIKNDLSQVAGYLRRQ